MYQIIRNITECIYMLKKLLERRVQNAAPCNVLPAANAPAAPPLSRCYHAYHG